MVRKEDICIKGRKKAVVTLNLIKYAVTWHVIISKIYCTKA